MEYKLTQYSHGAGCGCKISPQVLTKILGSSSRDQSMFPDLLVGNDHRDDAAVLDLGDGTAIISTTDFFMPIVDDPAIFGHIASVNAISDIYAMGGHPILAIAILGWPVDKLPPEVANAVVEGAREACAKAGIPLAGGHSIDSPEPIFGLAVTGRVPIENLKKNSGALPGDMIFMTKPLGIGVFTTAQKRGLLTSEHHTLVCEVMMQLNKIGEELSGIPEVHSMTDVTGFGLAGHLVEMCEASGLDAHLDYEQIPLLPGLHDYIEKGAIPGGTHRNFSSYGEHLNLHSEDQKLILCDPQTSGGLLIAVDPAGQDAVRQVFERHSITAAQIGKFTHRQDVSPSIRITAA